MGDLVDNSVVGTLKLHRGLGSVAIGEMRGGVIGKLYLFRVHRYQFRGMESFSPGKEHQLWVRPIHHLFSAGSVSAVRHNPDVGCNKPAMCVVINSGCRSNELMGVEYRTVLFATLSAFPCSS